jgi:predicted site-specific integrase-resolvase
MQRDQYITAKHVKDRYDISTTTLRRWADDEKKIRVLRVGEVAGRRLYHSGDIAKLLGDLPPVDARVVLLYARVSSAKQSGDLERQCTDLRERYPGAELIRDTASGLNFHRKGLTTVLERISTGTVRELVVTHKDRLARFGVELVEWICRQHETMLVVLGDVEVPADEDELRDDLLAVTTFFVARNNGRRSAENRKRRKAQEQEDHQHEDASEHSEEDSSQPNKGTRSPAHLVDAHQSMDVQPGGGVQTRVEEGAPRALCQQ